jgi:hypothetical protein
VELVSRYGFVRISHLDEFVFGYGPSRTDASDDAVTLYIQFTRSNKRL